MSNQLKVFITQCASGTQKIDELVRIVTSLREQSIHESSRAKRDIKAHFDARMTGLHQSTASVVKSNITQAGKNFTEAVQEINVQNQAKETAELLRERLLSSLKFPAMNERRNQILDVPEGSFEAIFTTCSTDNQSSDSSWTEDDSDTNGFRNDDSQQIPDSNSNIGIRSTGSASVNRQNVRHTHLEGDSTKFISWLKSDERLFWITGKPGSGKSTLVKFLISSPRTWAALDRWKPGCQAASHFFWKPGTNFQKNVKGLLSSLLHQVLLLDKSLIETVLDKDPNISDKDCYTDWEAHKLKSLLMSVLESRVRPLCIFIDGLDEVSGADSPADVLMVIDAIKCLPLVKVCVSSRPDPRFRLYLNGCPCIQLHELTAEDMREFSERSLAGLLESSDFGVDFVEILVAKAQGVFLWLSLALKDLRDGLTSQDTQSELLHRLEELPEDLSTMFAEMWSRVNGDSSKYRRKAALYLNLMLHDSTHEVDQTIRSYHSGRSRSMSLLLIMAATELSLRDATPADNDAIGEDRLEDLCEEGGKNIVKRCAGLMEIVSMEESYFGKLGWHRVAAGNLFGSGSSTTWTSRTVRFIHRTVYDFLLYSERGQQIRQADMSTESQHSYQLLVGLLVSFRYGAKTMRNDVVETVDSLALIADDDSRYRLFKACQTLYNSGYLDPHISAQGIHFLAAATSPLCDSFILNEVARDTDPPVLATVVLTDILRKEVPRLGLVPPLLHRGANPNAPRLRTHELLNGTTYFVSDSALGQHLQGLLRGIHGYNASKPQSGLCLESTLQCFMRTKPNLAVLKTLRVCLGRSVSTSPERYSFILTKGLTCPNYSNRASSFSHLKGLWRISAVFVLTVNLAFMLESIIRSAKRKSVPGFRHLVSERSGSYADILSDGISYTRLRMVIMPPAVGYRVVDDVVRADILAAIVSWLLGDTSDRTPLVAISTLAALERVADWDLEAALTEPLCQLDSPEGLGSSEVPDPHHYLFEKPSA